MVLFRKKIARTGTLNGIIRTTLRNELTPY